MKYLYFFVILLILFHSAQAQWQIQQSGTSENLNDVAILNQTAAVVVGDNGIILKSTNNGELWESKNSGTSNGLNAVSFRSYQNGIAVGNGVICRTSNAGENWSVTNQTKNFLNVSYREPYIFGPYIIIGDANGSILFSDNDGVSWFDTVLVPNEPIIAVGFNYYSPYQFSPIDYIASTQYTGVSISGFRWYLYENPINPAFDILTGGEFYNWNQYLIGYSGNPELKPILLRKISTETWEAIYTFVSAPFIPYDITGINEVLFVCGSNGKIFNSTNEGENWSEQFTGITTNLNAVSIRYDTIGYSVGANGTILFTSTGGVSSVEEIKHSSDFYLYQNYPNPFNPKTTIRFKISIQEFVSLKIYDLLGEEIAVFIQNEMRPGIHSVEFDASNLSSGMYFYTLTTPSFIQTKKMLLLK